MNAPTDNHFHTHASGQTDIAIRQWEDNVSHLKSQLTLAAGIIQAKGATIQMLELSNYQYKQLMESPSTKKNMTKKKLLKVFCQSINLKERDSPSILQKFSGD